MSETDSAFLCFQEALGVADAIAATDNLNRCFAKGPRKTLEKLYKEEILFGTDFGLIDASALDVSEVYRALIRLIQKQVLKTGEACQRLNGFSKKQLIQGAANHFEKDNAELKYNAAWAERHINGSHDYLETERQTIYFSRVGICFQELLRRLYRKAPDADVMQVSWTLNTAEIFLNVFHELQLFTELRDIVERHLFFNWKIELAGERAIAIQPGDNSKGKHPNDDFMIQMKSRILTDRIDAIAEEKLLTGYLFNRDAILQGFGKYFPEDGNAEEWKSYHEATALDVKADYTVERELTLLMAKYFPFIEEERVKELELNDGTMLPLRDAMRVCAFIAQLSKLQLAKSYAEYTSAVEHYSRKAKFSYDAFMLDRLAARAKGDVSKVFEAMKVHYTAEVKEQQEYVIWQAKNRIPNDACLGEQKLAPLVKTIQWMSGLETSFIEKVFDLLTYDPDSETSVARTPFFRIGDRILWLPNTMGCASSAENLMETLLANEKISIDKLQTEVYEDSLKKIFHSLDYYVISNDKDKIFKDNRGQHAGDFDLLAYRNGHLLHFQLKLTHIRDSYFSRYQWRQDQLKGAVTQLKKGNLLIKQEPSHIRKILGLTDDAPLDNTHCFILSNSFHFDGETISDFPKISFWEVMFLLTGKEEELLADEDFLRYKILEIARLKPDQPIPVGYKEWAERKQPLNLEQELPMIRNFVRFFSGKLWESDARPPELLVQYLKERPVFRYLESIPSFASDVHVPIDDWTVIRPGMIPRTRAVIQL